MCLKDLVKYGITAIHPNLMCVYTYGQGKVFYDKVNTLTGFAEFASFKNFGIIKIVHCVLREKLSKCRQV